MADHPLHPSSGVPIFSSPRDIEDFLRMELEIARIQRDEANHEFWRTSANVYDSSHDEKVRSAAWGQCVARKALVAALKRLNAFLANGTVPGEFEYPPREMSRTQAEGSRIQLETAGERY
jgi:hypothetical protein